MGVEGHELIAETNSLLRQILQRDEDRKKKAEEDRVEFEAKLKETTRIAESPKEDDLQKRLEAAQEQSKQRIEEMRVKDLEYKELMLNEVREQTQLLRAIREKLQA